MSEPITAPGSTKIFRAAIWVAIGALIAAALVCVVWVLVGDSNGIVGQAFLTILLLAGFAGIAILESALAARRQAWFTLASMLSWVLALLVGAFMIWMPEAPGAYAVGIERFFKFLLILLILQGALLHIRLFTKAFARYQTTFTSVVAYVTMGLLVILGIMLILPLMLAEFFDFLPIYWRVVVALAILVAVGTALVPLVNALFAPKKPRPVDQAPAGQYAYGSAYAASATPQAPEAAPQPQAWPTYADGRTPLPVLPDGSPDWNAYYTGWPTYPQPQAVAPTEPVAADAPPQQPQSPQPPAPQPNTAAPAYQPAPPVPNQPDYPAAPPAPPAPPQQ